MSTSLLGKFVAVTSNEAWPDPLTGVITAATKRELCVRLNDAVQLRDGQFTPYLVVTIRHADQETAAIVRGVRVLCNVTLVPVSRFDGNRPCDLSWWRGGDADVGDIMLMPESEPTTTGDK